MPVGIVVTGTWSYATPLCCRAKDSLDCAVAAAANLPAVLAQRECSSG